MPKQEQLTHPRRAVPYPGYNSAMYLPGNIWSETLASFSDYRDADSEGLVFWGGAIGACQELMITSLIRPRHSSQGWRVQLTPMEVKKLIRVLRDRDEKLIAQIHSHPDGAFHSPGDDRFATMFHVGFISIVVPNFAEGVSALSECAVYEFDGRKFVEVNQSKIQDRFVIYDQVVDLTVPIMDKNWYDRRRFDGKN